MNAPHIHLMLSHVPVIGVIFVAVALAAGLLWRRESLVRFALILLVAVSAAAIPVYFSGDRSEDAVEHMTGVQGSTIERHEDVSRLVSIALGVLGLLALASMAWYRHRDISRGVASFLLIAMVVVSGALAWTANLGGQIRHHEELRVSTAAASEPEEVPASHEDE